jgi:hypothetical protein
MGVWEYFTKEQQQKMTRNIEQFRPEQLKQMRKDSNAVLAKLIAACEEGTPPDNPDIVAAAKALGDLQALFDERDPEIEQAIEKFHKENPTEKDHGMDLEIYTYIQKAKFHVG